MATEKTIVIENATGSDMSMLRNGTHPRFVSGTVEPEGVIVEVTHVISEPQRHRLEVTVSLETTSERIARLRAQIAKLEAQRDAAYSAARLTYQSEIDELQQQIDRLQPEPEQKEIDGGEYGMVCIMCLEPATENINGEWYCKDHVPTEEKRWGGKREGAGRVIQERWIEGKQGWWGVKQYVSQSKAVLAAQKLTKRGLLCTAVRYEDGFFHLYTQYNPYSR